MKKYFLLAIAAFGMNALFAQKSFTPQDEGSKVHFVIKNMGFNVGGDLTGLKGAIKFDAKKPAKSSVDVTVDVNTIDTDNDRRDGHLKNEDFFDAPQYPTIRIKSTAITAGADLNHFNFTGELTMHGVTKPISFPFTAENSGDGAMFKGNFEINRNDFGVGKSGGSMNDTVAIELSVFAK